MGGGRLVSLADGVEKKCGNQTVLNLLFVQTFGVLKYVFGVNNSITTFSNRPKVSTFSAACRWMCASLRFVRISTIDKNQRWSIIAVASIPLSTDWKIAVNWRCECHRQFRSPFV